MSVAEFVGDEVSAAGYRLCGIEVHVADSGNALSLIKKSCERASLVLVSSTELDELLVNIQPPVLVVPDVCGLQDMPDIASRINKQLGLLE